MSRLSRRNLMNAAGDSAFVLATATSAGVQWPVVEGPDTPKICLLGGATDEASVRKVRQLGVNYLVGGGLGPIPWREPDVRAHIGRFKAAGITLYNAMIGGYPKTQIGRPGRDEEIDKIIQSIRAAGRAGLPVIEYTFQPRRAMEGYYEGSGRAGAGHTAFDYARVKDLPPIPEEGVHSLDEMWSYLTYFLKAIVPVAQQSGVRLALHPNDPPAPLIRGTALPLGTVAGWKRLIEVVPSPSNGITFDSA